MAVVIPAPARGSFVAFTERTAVVDDDPEKELIFARQRGSNVLPALTSSFNNFDFIRDGCGRIISALARNEEWRHQKIVPTYDCAGPIRQQSYADSDRCAFHASRGFSVVS